MENEKMLCPYRKTLERVIPLKPNGELHNIPTREIEGFEECSGKNCPLYYEVKNNPHCYRVEREKGFNE